MLITKIPCLSPQVVVFPVKMFNKHFFLLCLAIRSVFSEECQTFNFESEFDTLFDNFGFCASWPEEGWAWEEFSAIGVSPVHPSSTKFVSPGNTGNTLSCTSSFKFSVTAGGTLEVNAYMDATSPTTQILAFLYPVDENNTPVVTIRFLMSDSGWLTQQEVVTGSGTFEAYVSFLGAVTEGDIALVDSFRYIPPLSNDEEIDCEIYPEETGTTEPDTTEPGTTEPGTTEPGTTEPGTTEPDKTEPGVTDNTDVTGPGVTDDTEVTDPGVTDDTDVTGPGVTDNTDVTGPGVTDDTEVTGTGVTDDTEVTDPGVTDVTDVTEPGVTDGTEVTGTGVTDGTEVTGTDETEVTGTGVTDVTDSEETDVTEGPIIDGSKNSSFWNPLTITMVVIVSIIFLTLLSYCFYEIGKRKAQDKALLIYNDDIEVPPPVIVPRVTKLYSDSSMLNSMYSK